MEIEQQTVTTPVAQQQQTLTRRFSSMEIQQQQTVATPVSQPQQSLTGRFCRVLFTCIFYLQLISISVLVIFLALRGLLFTKSQNFHPKKWHTPLLSSVAVSGLLSLAWQCFFICNIHVTVRATFLFAPLLTISVGIFLLKYGTTVAPGIGLLLVIFSISQTCYGWIYVVPKKHKFTFKMLPIATGLLLPARTRGIALVSVILSVFYSGFLVAGIGGATATKTGLLDILFISIIVISFAWTMQVVKNVQQVAISKARYVYFARKEEMNACDALGFTMKNQLGSICIGSTLIPVFVLIRGMIRTYNKFGRSNDQTRYANGEGCCDWIVNHLILYGNRWGFVHVGVYNKGFVQASRDTWTTFRRVAGLEQLIDSDVTSSICFLSAFSIGATSALTAGVWALLIHKDYLFQLTLYAFIIGYFVGRVSSAWLQGCVMGYYVAYSENPRNTNFDDTIPQRIERQNIENAEHDAFYEVREEEEEQEVTYA